jgi:PRTRC genetic system protein E
MFKELVPILRSRAVLMTATALDDDQIRVNVVPKKMKDGDHDALTTPLSVTGTAEELDTQLAATLVGFVASHLQMKNALEKAKSEMDAATKAAQAEARAKAKTPPSKTHSESRTRTGRCCRSVTRTSKTSSRQARFALRRSRACRGRRRSHQRRRLHERTRGERRTGRGRLIAVGGRSPGVLSTHSPQPRTRERTCRAGLLLRAACHVTN